MDENQEVETATQKYLRLKLIKLNDDGSADVTLSKPLSVDGVPVSQLRMREPLVRDSLVMEQSKGDPAKKELNFFANLCGIAPSDIEPLPTRDYQRIQAAYGLFTD